MLICLSSGFSFPSRHGGLYHSFPFVALCVLSITMAKGRGKGGKHGQGKHDDKPMDGPNSDHKPTGVASNVSCRPLLEITDAGRSHRYMFLQVFL
jgi:hypothetical protein